MAKLEGLRSLRRTVQLLSRSRNCFILARNLSEKAEFSAENTVAAESGAPPTVPPSSKGGGETLSLLEDNQSSTNFSTSPVDLKDSLHDLAETTNDNESKEYASRKQSFPYLLRHSAFVNMGDFTDKAVLGTIFQVVDNDLYIDFGWKFHCVCSRPEKNQGKYVRGARVKLLINSLELSTRFLGATRDITLCEADCTLVGLYQR